MDYEARRGYRDKNGVDRYIENRFSGLLGRYRYWTEQRAVERVLKFVDSGSTIADIPCGTGRWWRLLKKKANSIVALDLSPAMVEKASGLATSLGGDISVENGDAEQLDLANDSVDYVFSYALFKHLPIPVQYKVLLEFSRVCRKGVIVSYSQFEFYTYSLYKMRNSRKKTRSMLLLPHLEHMAAYAGLELICSVKSSTLLGVERVGFLRKL